MEDSKKSMYWKHKWNRNQCERNVEGTYNGVNYKVKNKIMTPL